MLYRPSTLLHQSHEPLLVFPHLLVLLLDRYRVVAICNPDYPILFAYEKGFIDGMAQMIESAVHHAVEGMAVKELTDEEIQEVAHGFGAIGWMGDTTYEFARAILRKAQE